MFDRFITPLCRFIRYQPTFLGCLPLELRNYLLSFDRTYVGDRLSLLNYHLMPSSSSLDGSAFTYYIIGNRRVTVKIYRRLNVKYDITMITGII